MTYFCPRFSPLSAWRYSKKRARCGLEKKPPRCQDSRPRASRNLRAGLPLILLTTEAGLQTPARDFGTPITITRFLDAGKKTRPGQYSARGSGASSFITGKARCPSRILRAASKTMLKKSASRLQLLTRLRKAFLLSFQSLTMPFVLKKG